MGRKVGRGSGEVCENERRTMECVTSIEIARFFLLLNFVPSVDFPIRVDSGGFALMNRPLASAYSELAESLKRIERDLFPLCRRRMGNFCQKRDNLSE